MDLHIFIPTYRRVDRQLTWDKLPPALRKRTVLVVPQDEALAHKAKGRNVLVSPDQGLGMAAIRGWIVRYAQRNKMRYIAIVDDDLTMQIRKGGKIVNSTPEEQVAGFEWMSRTLKEVPTCAFGVRFLNYASDEEYISAVRQMQVIGVDTRWCQERGINFDVGVPPWFPMDDFNFTLQVLTRGGLNRVSLVYRANPAPANAPGGCSEQRTLERQNESARILWNLFPQYVKVRLKKAWQGMDGDMYDVTVQWKKAYVESGFGSKEKTNVG